MSVDTPLTTRVRGRGERPRHGGAAIRRRRRVYRTWARVAIGLLLVVEIYPLVWMFLTSLKSYSDYLNHSTWSLPTTWACGNYTEAWTTGHIGLYVRNSLLAVVPSLALILLLGTAAGFALQIMVLKG